MNPLYAVLFAIGITAGAGLIGYQKGYDAHATQAQAELAAHLKRAIAEANEQAEQDREILLASEVRKAKTRTVFETIEKEVIRYASIHVADADCLSPDGLRLWTHANAGTDPAAAGAPAERVPGQPAAPAVGQGAGPAGQSRPGGAYVPRVPGAAPEPRRVGIRRPHWGWD